MYCFICEECAEEADICASMNDVMGIKPHCPKCHLPMRRGWAKEQLGKPIGAGDWPKVTNDLGEDGEPTVYRSYKELDRLAAERGCHVFTGDPERRYKFKHFKDRLSGRREEER